MTKLEKAIEIYNALEIRKYDDMPVVEHVFSDGALNQTAEKILLSDA